MAAPRFQVQFASDVRNTPVDGRLLLILSKTFDGEPRFQVNPEDLQTAQIFGVDVNGWRPGDPVEFGSQAVGSPLRHLGDLPSDTYNIQAVLNVYETVHRSDGHVLQLHMDHGAGQQALISPGNLYSEPERVAVNAGSLTTVTLTKVNASITSPKDTKFVRHVSLQSKLLSNFWGRPTDIGAIVLVPDGFDDHPTQRYPVVFLQGHSWDALSYGLNVFREEEPEKKPEHKNWWGQLPYRFYQDWISGQLPRVLLVVTEHSTPYFDDSYGVNSANMGPYGDALTQELYPYIETRFRAIGEPWSRVLLGGSTGGWIALAEQIFYPDYFGGAWGFCPDPVDFHVFQSINLYSDKNAYVDEGSFARFPKLISRTPADHIGMTVETLNRFEAAMGSRARSGSQLDAFHATFGPTDAAGYPARLWDAETGIINPEIAKYWTDHYDLTGILQRHWQTLGPKLIGKLHVTMGTKDTYFLDAAARRMQEFLETTKLPGAGPYYAGSFDFGNNEPHCYVGQVPKGVPTLSYYIPMFAEHMSAIAPKGVDTSGWR